MKIGDKVKVLSITDETNSRGAPKDTIGEVGIIVMRSVNDNGIFLAREL